MSAYDYSGALATSAARRSRSSAPPWKTCEVTMTCLSIDFSFPFFHSSRHTTLKVALAVGS